jgi:hypothetical protein
MAASTIYFPLRSNAAGLVAGNGVALIRRRIILAGLLHDEVYLEDGVFSAFAGPGGGSSVTMHGESLARWQTTRQRHELQGATHHVGARREGGDADGPMHAVIVTPATYSWRASFEPFRDELPSSAARWLNFGHITDNASMRRIVQDWQRVDRLVSYGGDRRRPSLEHHFVTKTILDATYKDLAAAAVAGVSVSIDRRHQTAVRARVTAGDATPVGGHHALGLVVPGDISWSDVDELRRMRGMRDYRAVVRDIEAMAFAAGGSGLEIDARTRREYQARVDRAIAGMSLGGRAAMQLVGFVAGAVADSAQPFIGGAVASGAAFVVQEAIQAARRPTWLSVHRRANHRIDGV